LIFDLGKLAPPIAQISGTEPEVTDEGASPNQRSKMGKTKKVLLDITS
jgi:hypothetical protein